MVDIVQADRNEAANYLGDPFVRVGHHDNHALVQAFARHRVAALTASGVGEVVALRAAMRGAKLIQRGSSNHGCTVEVEFPGSGKASRADNLLAILKRIKTRAALASLGGGEPSRGSCPVCGGPSPADGLECGIECVNEGVRLRAGRIKKAKRGRRSDSEGIAQ